VPDIKTHVTRFECGLTTELRHDEISRDTIEESRFRAIYSKHQNLARAFRARL